ncbi:Uncharacterised protein [Chlamydia abortus]|nr:Uncharacterised protein [Chlamydia abortus]
MSGTPATSTRPGRTWSLRGGGWRLLREPLPVAGPVGPAPAGAERHGRSAAAAGYRGRIGSGSPDRWSRPDGHGPLGRSAAMGGDSCKTVSRSPDRSARPRPTRSLRGGSWRSLPWRLGHGGTVYLAPAGCVRLGRSAAAARGRCRGGWGTAERSTRPRRAPSASVAPRRLLGVAAGLLGHGGKVYPAPAGPVRLGRSAAAARGRCRGGWGTAERSTRPRRAPSGSVAPRRRLEVAAVSTRKRQNGLPGPGRLRPARSLRGGG